MSMPNPTFNEVDATNTLFEEYPAQYKGTIFEDTDGSVCEERGMAVVKAPELIGEGVTNIERERKFFVGEVILPAVPQILLVEKVVAGSNAPSREPLHYYNAVAVVETDAGLAFVDLTQVMLNLTLATTPAEQAGAFDELNGVAVSSAGRIPKKTFTESHPLEDSYVTLVRNPGALQGVRGLDDDTDMRLKIVVDVGEGRAILPLDPETTSAATIPLGDFPNGKPIELGLITEAYSIVAARAAELSADALSIEPQGEGALRVNLGHANHMQTVNSIL